MISKMKMDKKELFIKPETQRWKKMSKTQHRQN